MEIDFLGLNSSKYNLECDNSETPFPDTAGGVEISLSLSTSSSLDFSEKKKWEFPACDTTISSSCSGSTVSTFAPPLLRHSTAGFLYDLNDTATVNLRNMPLFTEPQKAENTVYIAGNSSTGGYTPTVAMARRATLARFLEKRLHRINQGRATQFMGKPLRGTNSEACESRNSNLKTRQ